MQPNQSYPLQMLPEENDQARFHGSYSEGENDVTAFTARILKSFSRISNLPSTYIPTCSNFCLIIRSRSVCQNWEQRDLHISHTALVSPSLPGNRDCSRGDPGSKELCAPPEILFLNQILFWMVIQFQKKHTNKPSRSFRQQSNL